MKINRLFLWTLLLGAGTNAVRAQYTMDLTNIRQPVLHELTTMGHPGQKGKELKVNNLYMTIDGKPVLPVMGEFHFSRYDCRHWRSALRSMKASGVDIVATYVIWNLHEETEGNCDWTGNLDLRRFLQICQEEGLLVHLRFGPYCNAEIRNGGLPDWLISQPGIRIRSNDPLYLAYSRKWYEAIYKQVEGLLYKDGGPVMALQLENEYVTKGLVIPHLMRLKQMARECGFDVPIYTMTHWMASDYPKGEIVPYAGYYIETPWTSSGTAELPVSPFEFFSYKRLSDNIATDIIDKGDCRIESMDIDNQDSPYFTCEVGVGTTNFYGRRAVVPEEMAGTNICLRLGCGVNLMGYYMYVGGSNPVGRLTTMQSSGPRIGYDYQAPVREYGTLGTVMGETKKMNYFMNDFGSLLAPMVAYMPTENARTENLQWAVRTDGQSGFLFCSNYLYKRHRPTFGQVRFRLNLKNGPLEFPRNSVSVRDGAYFVWPFNLDLDGIRLVYATAQPICKHEAPDGTPTYFFFADDGIEAELFVEGAKRIRVRGARAVREATGRWFIDRVVPGKDNLMELTASDGRKVRIVILTEPESDMIWKNRMAGKNVVALTRSSVEFLNDRMVLQADTASQEVWTYVPAGFKSPSFVRHSFTRPACRMPLSVRALSPFDGAGWIAPDAGNEVWRDFDVVSLSAIAGAVLRVAGDKNIECTVNDRPVRFQPMGEYLKADITTACRAGKNSITLRGAEQRWPVAAQIDVELQNGERMLFPTDATWRGGADKKPVILADAAARRLPETYAPDEHLACYALSMSVPDSLDAPVRLHLSMDADVADAYINGQLYNDTYCNGAPWILGVDRSSERLNRYPLVLRLRGFKTDHEPVYLEKGVSMADAVHPRLKRASLVKDYRYELPF